MECEGSFIFKELPIVSDHGIERSGSFGVQSGVCHLPRRVYYSRTGFLRLDGASSYIVQIPVTPRRVVQSIIRGGPNARRSSDQDGAWIAIRTVHSLQPPRLSSLRSDARRYHPLVSTAPHPQRERMGVFTLNGLYRLFQQPPFAYPLVVLEGQGCRDLASLPTATVNVLATNDQGRNWCLDHSDGARGSGVWHGHCAHVRACQMSGWLRRQTNVLPTLFQVNAQSCCGNNGVIDY